MSLLLTEPQEGREQEELMECPRCKAKLWYWALTGFYLCFNVPCEYWIHEKDVAREQEESK